MTAYQCPCGHLRVQHRHGSGRCMAPRCGCLHGPPKPPLPAVLQATQRTRARTTAPDGIVLEVARAPRYTPPHPDEPGVVCRFTVPGEPVPKARPRFDPRSGRTYTPATTVEAEKLIAGYFKETYPHLEPCAEPVGLHLRFHLKGVGRGDWDNYGKLVSDSLNGKAWCDDKQVRKADVELFDHARDPRSDILVYRIGERLL